MSGRPQKRRALATVRPQLHEERSGITIAAITPYDALRTPSGAQLSPANAVPSSELSGSAPGLLPASARGG
jgi:hypothetical protein